MYYVVMRKGMKSLNWTYQIMCKHPKKSWKIWFRENWQAHFPLICEDYSDRLVAGYSGWAFDNWMLTLLVNINNKDSNINNETESRFLRYVSNVVVYSQQCLCSLRLISELCCFKKGTCWCYRSIKKEKREEKEAVVASWFGNGWTDTK